MPRASSCAPGAGLPCPVRNSIPVLLVDEARQTSLPQAEGSAG